MGGPLSITHFGHAERRCFEVAPPDRVGEGHLGWVPSDFVKYYNKQLC